MVKRKQLAASITLALVASSGAQAVEFIVQTTGDAGGGTPVLVAPDVYEIDTLRSAVEQADNEANFSGGDVISFDPDLFLSSSATITLATVGDVYTYIGNNSNSALGINSNITINGPDDGDTLNISGGNTIRHFQVNNGGNLTINRVNLLDGYTPSNIAGTGGAIVIDGGGSLTLNDSRVSNCVAETGGAINFRHNSNTSYINRSTFTGNSTTGSFGSGTGGAVFKRGYDTLYVDESTFTGNTANYSGGGLFSSGELVVTNSTIQGNHAERGGGGIETNNIGVLTLINSTVSGNTADTVGGGIRIGTENGYSIIINSTITGNLSDADNAPYNTLQGGGPSLDTSGGGLFASNVESVELHNTVIANNHETQSMTPDDVAANMRTQSSHNLFGVVETSYGVIDGSNGNQVGTPLNPIDAQIQPLADNGGATLTHVLASTSPAINAGDNTIVTNYALAYDQRGVGFDRVSGTVDLGSVESDVIFADGLEQ